MRCHWIVLAIAALAAGHSAFAAEEAESAPEPFRLEDPLPYGQQPIDYHGPETDDAAARLNAKLEAGEVELPFDARHGYLPALLEFFGVSADSQVLVFSKTALNPRLVGPKNPRAVYFNDEVSVGFVPGAAALEVTAVDPQKGPMFYILSQAADAKPRLVREGRCLACHAGQTTLQVPGMIVRSFLTDDDGNPKAGYSRVTHQTPLSKRWGGWYVTGTHGDQPHLGNLIGEEDGHRHKDDPSFGGNVTDLTPYIETSRYISPHSDLVAHLVLAHQAHGQNLLARVNYEARLNRRSDAEEELLKYLLFADEAALTAPVRGTSAFAKWFQQQGPRDRHGRSMRELVLQTRLFKYRLSYLIFTRQFDALPADVKERLYGRLWQIFNGRDPAPEFQHIPPAERKAIGEILRATKNDLPAEWTGEPGASATGAATRTDLKSILRSQFQAEKLTAER